MATQPCHLYRLLVEGFANALTQAEAAEALGIGDELKGVSGSERLILKLEDGAAADVQGASFMRDRLNAISQLRPITTIDDELTG
jgi:hypothetical protein